MDSNGLTALPIFGYVDDKEQVKELRGYLIKCGAKIKEVGPADLSDDVVELAKNVRVIGTGPNQDANGILMTLNSLASLVVPLSKNSGVAVAALCEGLTDGAAFDGVGQGSKAQTAFCVLSNLFHGFGAGQKQIQFSLYCAMLSIAARGGFMEEVPTDLATVKEWFSAWGLGEEQRRSCLRLIHRGLAAWKGAGDESSAVMLELLSTYSAADAGEATADAKSCVLTAVADPKTFLYDHLLLLPPVKSLQKAEPKLYALLTILVNGTLKDYQAFDAKEKDYVKKLGLSEPAMIHKMRILTLMSIAETKTEVDFSSLSSMLSMSAEEELEEFIIQASLSHAIRGRIDQVGQRLVIQAAQSRLFERKEWELLRARLDQWSANLSAAKETLDSVVPA